MKDCYKKEELEDKRATEQKKESSLGAVFLLAAKVEACAGGTWSAPTLFATLQRRSSPEQWEVLAGGSTRAGRGRCQKTKSPLATLWGKME